MGARKTSVTVLALVLVCTDCEAPPRDSVTSETPTHEGKVTAVTEDQAREAAAKFLRIVKPDLEIAADGLRDAFPTVTQDTNPRVGLVWEMTGPPGMVAVAATTGEVVSWSDGDDLDGIETRITLDEAERSMRAFLRAAYPQFDERRFELEEREESEGRFNFGFEQVRLPDEVSIYHNSVAVSLRADKPRVVSYDRSALAFVRREPTRLSAADARRIVREIVGPQTKITKLDLFEHPVGDLTRAVTVWAASVLQNVGGLEDLDMILINADTGERVPFEQ
jgi:hypothetical protein